MPRKKIFFVFVLIFILAIALSAGACFAGNTDDDDDDNTTTTSKATVIIPDPEVVSVVASTSGTEDAYYVTLDIKVTNNGADGIILIEATVTQGDEIQKDETTVFLKQNADYEYKMTFPLEWKGGDFETDVTASLP